MKLFSSFFLKVFLMEVPYSHIESKMSFINYYWSNFISFCISSFVICYTSIYWSDPLLILSYLSLLMLQGCYYQGNSASKMETLQHPVSQSACLSSYFHVLNYASLSLSPEKIQEKTVALHLRCSIFIACCLKA